MALLLCLILIVTALDLPVPHDDCLHVVSVRDALIGLASQRKSFKGSFLYGALLF